MVRFTKAVGLGKRNPHRFFYALFLRVLYLDMELRASSGYSFSRYVFCRVESRALHTEVTRTQVVEEGKLDARLGLKARDARAPVWTKVEGGE